MPIFEYRCESCGCKFERLVSGNPQVSCPQCTAPNPKRLFSVFGHKSSSGFVSSQGKDSCTSCGHHHCGSCHH